MAKKNKTFYASSELPSSAGRTNIEKPYSSSPALPIIAGKIETFGSLSAPPIPGKAFMTVDRPTISMNSSVEKIVKFLRYSVDWNPSQMQTEATACAGCLNCTSSAGRSSDLPGCPVGIDNRARNAAAADGNYREAHRLTYTKNPAALWTSLLCGTLKCVEPCVLEKGDHGGMKNPSIERAISILGVQNGWYPMISSVAYHFDRAQKPGIVGAGIAGYTVSYLLGINAFPTITYDQCERFGGVLGNYLPDTKLPYDETKFYQGVIEKSAGHEQYGGRFNSALQLNTPIGPNNFSISEMTMIHSDIVLATGKHRKRPMRQGDFENDWVSSLHQIEYVKFNNQTMTVDDPWNPAGSHTLIYGIGDTSADDVNDACDLEIKALQKVAGHKENSTFKLTIIYRGPRENPSNKKLRDETTEYKRAKKKAALIAQMRGLDPNNPEDLAKVIEFKFHTVIPPNSTSRNEDGTYNVRCRRTEMVDGRPKEIKNTDFVITADRLTNAIGFETDADPMKAFGLAALNVGLDGQIHLANDIASSYNIPTTGIPMHGHNHRGDFRIGQHYNACSFLMGTVRNGDHTARLWVAQDPGMASDAVRAGRDLCQPIALIDENPVHFERQHLEPGGFKKDQIPEFEC